MCEKTIIEKCAEFRQRSNTKCDEFIPDINIFLEQMLVDSEGGDREARMVKIGRA